MTSELTKEDGDLSLKLFVVLNRAMQSVKKRVEEDIRSYGLNPTEFAVLELLFHKGDHPIQKIGDKVLIASSSITYVVDKLEKKKLVKRKACPKDRRTTYAAITAEGRSLMESIFPKHKNSITKLFAGLTVEEKDEMIKQLKKLGYDVQKKT
jgi:MarR family 2-MHQ and catechol resistance regulon transcriptional repressor